MIKNVICTALGFACATAFAAQSSNFTTIEQQFLDAHGAEAKSIAPGVYETKSLGGTRRYSFGSEGALYELSIARQDLAALQSQQQIRELNASEVQVVNALQQRVTALQAVVSSPVSFTANPSASQSGGPTSSKAAIASLRGAQPNIVAIDPIICGVNDGDQSLFALDPATTTTGLAVAISDRLQDFFAPLPPDTDTWTLNASAVVYSTSAKIAVRAADTPSALVTHGPAPGRLVAYAPYERGGHTCYGVSTASVTTNICGSPNNFKSVTDSTACP